MAGASPAGTPRFEDWDYGSDPETEDKLTSLDGEDLDTAEVSTNLNVEEVHELWRDADPQPRHPLAPLVRAWWKRPQHIEADTHPDAILPAGTLQHAPSATYRSLEIGGDRTREPDQFELAYPGKPGKVAPETVQLDLLPAEHADVPVTPLLLADAAGFSELQQGRGARLDKRIFLYALAAMPMSARVSGGSYMWEPTLEQIRDLLWPKSPRTGRSSWKPSKHDRALNQALDAVNLAKVKLPNRDLWLPVRTWRQPDPRNLDSRALIEIALPPGGAIGGPQTGPEKQGGSLTAPSRQHQELEGQLHDRPRPRGPHRLDRRRHLAMGQRPHVAHDLPLRAELPGRSGHTGCRA